MNPMSEIEAAVSTGPNARLSLMNVYELVESTPEPAWLGDDAMIEAQPLIIGGAIKTLIAPCLVPPSCTTRNAFPSLFHGSQSH